MHKPTVGIWVNGIFTRVPRLGVPVCAVEEDLLNVGAQLDSAADDAPP
jgi:hypothetical protein